MNENEMKLLRVKIKFEMEKLIEKREWLVEQMQQLEALQIQCGVISSKIRIPAFIPIGEQHKTFSVSSIMSSTEEILPSCKRTPIAFWPLGTLIHTNEFLLPIGESYFVEGTATQALSLLRRKKDILQEALDSLLRDLRELEKQYVVFDSNSRILSISPASNQIFDIVEEYHSDDEDELSQTSVGTLQPLGFVEPAEDLTPSKDSHMAFLHSLEQNVSSFPTSERREQVTAKVDQFFHLPANPSEFFDLDENDFDISPNINQNAIPLHPIEEERFVMKNNFGLNRNNPQVEKKISKFKQDQLNKKK